MKIVRFGAIGQERPGVLLADGSIADVSSLVPDILPGTESFNGLLSANSRSRASLPKALPSVRLGVRSERSAKLSASDSTIANTRRRVTLPYRANRSYFSRQTHRSADPMTT